MADTPKVAVFMGAGLLSGTLPDGRPCLYYGGVVRRTSPHKVALEFTQRAVDGCDALEARGELRTRRRSRTVRLLGRGDGRHHADVARGMCGDREALK
jgi:hypothetical protein